MSSRLMALPAELRLSIYEYVFSSDDFPKLIDVFDVKYIYPLPTLLSVSRQTHKEALPEHGKAVENFWATKEFAVCLRRKHASRAERCNAIQRCESMNQLHAQRINFLWISLTDVPSSPGLAIHLRINAENKLEVPWYRIGDDAAEEVRTLIRQVAEFMSINLAMSSGEYGIDIVEGIKSCFAAMHVNSKRGRSWPHIP